MVQNCCVSVCRKRKLRGDNAAFHKFPASNLIKMKWFAAVNKTNEDLLKNKDLRVCSRHFVASDYIFGGNVRKLKTTAVPKVNLCVIKKENINPMNSMSFADTSTEQVSTENYFKNELFILKNEKQQLMAENYSLTKDVAVKLSKIKKLEAQVSVLHKEIEHLKQENNTIKKEHQHNQSPFTINKFVNDNKKIIYMLCKSNCIHIVRN